VPTYQRSLADIPLPLPGEVTTVSSD
jgi:hypothetical protein